MDERDSSRDVPVMYEGNGWRITDVSIELWEQRTIEDAETVMSSAAD